MQRDYAEYAQAFERCDIDAADFRHIDHIGVAHALLLRYGYLDASVIYCKCIDQIATEAGAAQKFNTTITLAFLSLIAERMESSPDNSFEDFIAEHPDLLSPDILARRYSPERLASDSARTMFLLPDLAA